MTDLRDFANVNPSAPSPTDPANFIEAYEECCPIDDFYSARTDLIRLADPHLMANKRHGRLLLLGIISAFENYCRGILSGCIFICPHCQSISSEKTINLGGALWYGKSGALHRSAFDLKSFADSEEVLKTFRQYVGLELKQTVFATALGDFERLMQFRHAIVHSDGVLSGRNAIKLEIEREGRPLRVVITFDDFQNSVASISAFAETLNRELFDLFCRRWAVEWRGRADWDPAKERQKLQNFFDLFVSKRQLNGRTNSRNWGPAALKRNIEARYQIP